MHNSLSLDLAISEFLSFEGTVDSINNKNKYMSTINTIKQFGYYDGMTNQEFIDMSILIADKLAPKSWRKGQAIFNYIDEFFHIARYIQFNKHIDCFYNDSKIEDFLFEAYKIISNN